MRRLLWASTFLVFCLLESSAHSGRARKALRRVSAIQKTLSRIRELPFKKNVRASRQSKKAFVRYLESEIAKEISPQKREDHDKALVHLGFLRDGKELVPATRELLAAQTFAYYDTKRKRFFLVDLADEDLRFDVVIAHEIQHALQDQHFDLRAFYEDRAPSLTRDERLARQFIVEGEATFLMAAFMLSSQENSPRLSSERGAFVVQEMRELAALKLETLAGLSNPASPEQGTRHQNTQEVIAATPLFVLGPLLAAYTKGVLPVADAFERGRWDEVNQLFENPPESTEQVLHPAKLVGERDKPMTVFFTKPNEILDWRLLDSDVMGEFLWKMYFGEWEVENFENTAKGWGGDRYAVFEDKKGRVAGIFLTKWDSNLAAFEFCADYVRTLKKRFPGSVITKGAGEARMVRRSDGTVLWMGRKQNSVLILDGFTTRSPEAFANLAAFVTQ